jgi:preprotein translocase subunit SecG
MIQNVLRFAQPIFAILSMASILVQAKGVGLSQTWGGSGGFYSSRRGVEKLLFRATIIFVAAFFLVSIAIHLI